MRPSEKYQEDNERRKKRDQLGQWELDE
jgi:hypothetical protein